MSTPFVSFELGKIRMESLKALQGSLEALDIDNDINWLDLYSELRSRGWELVRSDLLQELLKDGGRG